jgi:phospholipid/cholesterol/gamma-HCH transport system substrate-binding protein
MKNTTLELTVGLFVLCGLVAMAWLSIKLARMELMGSGFFTLSAQFTSIAGLKQGASVEIAGVEIGRVEEIVLDPNTFQARVRMRIREGTPIQEDAIAAVRTKGLIGDRYIKLIPGASERLLKEGDNLYQSEPAIHFEELISQFIHGSLR